jgi:hypothetical protein
MKNVTMELDWSELIVAAQIGIMRRVNSLKNGRKDQGLGPSDWTIDIEGAAAELALAKYLNVYTMPAINTFKAPDVQGFQVRSTKYSNGRLIIRPKDNGDAPYVLAVTGDLPRVTLVGLLPSGGAAKVPKYDHDDSWWVPQCDLTDLPERSTIGDINGEGQEGPI